MCHFSAGIAILSALITYFFIHPLDHDGMEAEDQAFREYLEDHGYDTSRMGLLTAEEIRSLEEKTLALERGSEEFQQTATSFMNEKETM